MLVLHICQLHLPEISCIQEILNTMNPTSSANMSSAVPNLRKCSSNNEGQLVASRYQLDKKLGEGGFCDVYRARDLEKDSWVAVKRARLDTPSYRRTSPRKVREKIRKVFLHEADVMKGLQHKYIVHFYNLVEEEEFSYIIMEYAAGGELFERIISKGSFSEHDASKCIQQVLTALEYLHMCGVVHRDLKPENILYSDFSENAHILLTDFGLSKKVDDSTLMMTECGTLEYTAPEMLLGRKNQQGYGPEVDVWSVGVVTFVLLSGITPFYSASRNDVEVREKILNGDFSNEPLEDTNTSTTAIEFIHLMLQVSPKQRATISTLLQHPWVQNEQEANHANIYEVIQEDLKKTAGQQRWHFLNKAVNVLENLFSGIKTPVDFL